MAYVVKYVLAASAVVLIVTAAQGFYTLTVKGRLDEVKAPIDPLRNKL